MPCLDEAGNGTKNAKTIREIRPVFARALARVETFWRRGKFPDGNFFRIKKFWR
jgi:hypothetical protein